MAQIKVTFKKSGSAYGYGYFAGQEGTIAKADLDKMSKAGVIEELKEQKPKAEKETDPA